MGIERIRSDAVFEAANALHSGCLRVGDQIFLSGMTASGPDGRAQAVGDMLGQTRICLEKIRNVVEAAGGTIADIVKITIYVTDISRRAEVNQAREEFFRAPPYPCSTFLEVSRFVNPELLVEIDATAICGAGGGAGGVR